MRILILGGDADGNLGDRAILQSMCVALRSARPGTELTVVSGAPDRARAAYGAEVVPRGVLGLPRLCVAALGSDLVLVGGGGLFQDDDSLIKMPYWALRLLLVRLLCRRVAGYSLGVGPLDAMISRVAARLAFATMERITVRDGEARTVARRLTGRNVEVLPDPALMLTGGDRAAARRLLEEHGVPLDGRPLVGVAARRWFPRRRRIVPNVISARWRGPDIRRSGEARRLTELLARVLEELVTQRGVFVVFMPTYTLVHEGDDAVCERIAARMPAGSSAMLRVDDPAAYKAITAELSVMLGGRMHPTILAASAGTAVVGLAYNQKFRGFFELIGQERRLMQIESFVAERREETLRGMLEDALDDPRDIAERTADRLVDRLDDVHGEFGRPLPLPFVAQPIDLDRTDERFVMIAVGTLHHHAAVTVGARHERAGGVGHVHARIGVAPGCGSGSGRQENRNQLLGPFPHDAADVERVAHLAVE